MLITQPEASIHRQPAYSRDGGQVAFVRRWIRGGPFGGLASIDLTNGNIHYLTNDGALVLSPAFSPQEDYIYFAFSRRGATNIWKIHPRGGAPEQVTAGQGGDTA